MRVGIDISQTAYSNTGVANFVKELVLHLAKHDMKNEYVLFFSSLRRSVPGEIKQLVAKQENIKLKQYMLPPTFLDILWNRVHIMPLELFIGNVDIFITSDWTEPPAKRAQKITFLYDLIVYTSPEETSQKIIATQKRRLAWVAKESQKVVCISESTKKDAEKLLNISQAKLAVVYPGITL